jgi:hypothetical protein
MLEGSLLEAVGPVDEFLVTDVERINAILFASLLEIRQEGSDEAAIAVALDLLENQQVTFDFDDIKQAVQELRQ